MKCLKEEDGWLKNRLKRQPIEKKQYRLSKFVVKLPVDVGFLLYNTATGSMFHFENDTDYNNSKDSLINNYYLIPDENFNEFTWVDFLRDKKRELTNNSTMSFIVMTTMDCNARCFYCYEKGRKPIEMSEKTAEDVSNFIVAKAQNKNVKFTWFGGEPLVNYKAIDIICSKLREKNIIYNSHVISNGLLFSSNLINKAKDLWNLKQVQITIDGTEDNYKKIKAYKNANGKEFYNVIHNIINLLENEIAVSIRLNQNLSNTEDLLKLADYIKENINYKNVSVYNRLLFDEEITEELQDAYFNLKSKLRNLHLFKQNIGDGISYSQCMADKDSSFVITPNGSLGKCEHFSEEKLIGSIYNNELNNQVIAQFKEQHEKLPLCNNCSFYPSCVRLKMCPAKLDVCSDLFRKDLLDNLHHGMKSYYKNHCRSANRF